MTKQEHIDYWIRSSNDDFEIFKTLNRSKKYVFALFTAHLILEKLIKAHWVKDNESSIPPKTHNLVYLANQTELNLSSDDMELCAQFNDFQLQGRYPDYQFKIHKQITEDIYKDNSKKFQELRKCLLKKIV